LRDEKTSRVLIVEDSNQKYSYIEGVLEDVGGLSWRRAESIRSAFSLIKGHDWDIILLDMNFENTEGIARDTRKEPLAGVEVLQFLDSVGSEAQVIVVTQHDSFALPDGSAVLSLHELNHHLEEAFPKNYIGLIPARLARSDWLANLRGLLGGG